VAVEERRTVDPRVATEKIGGGHIRIAAPGDTLHGIAFENGLNVNKLAAWNDIGDTSKLRIGQRIRLTRPLGYVDKVKKANKVASTVKTADSEVVTSRTLPKPSRNKAVVSQKARNSTKPAPIDKKPSTKSPTRKPSAIAKAPPKSKLSWRWPTAGKVVARFNTRTNQQGINIQGKLGQPVLAAGGGEVVYVGNGLKGYGNLVIIKHNEEFLSAYAHNQETFVAEGQRVAQGFRIAILGKDNQRRDALHFQIRQNGQPINPLIYLPKR